MKPYDLMIDNVQILTLDARDTRIEKGLIGIEHDTITLLEKQTPGTPGTPGTAYQAKERIDGNGMLAAVPGFVNTHVHCFQFLLKGLGQISL